MGMGIGHGIAALEARLRRLEEDARGARLRPGSGGGADTGWPEYEVAAEENLPEAPTTPAWGYTEDTGWLYWYSPEDDVWYCLTHVVVGS